MRDQTQRRCQLMLLVVTAFIFFSCNDTSNVPFPEKELGYSQPVTVPISFGEIKKLRWDTVKTNGIHPVVKKLDLDALPSVPYDTAGYRPLAKSHETRFDFNSLPETSFKLDSLSNIALDFKISLLPPPLIIKSSAPAPQNGKPLSILDFGQQQGLQAKFITSLLRDKDGLIWIATLQGIFRYDGEHIQRFITGPFPSLVAGMVQDNEGRIWYIQPTGVGMIDVQAGFSYYSKKIGSIQDNMAKMLKDANGLIWVFNSLDKAMSIIDPKKATFKNFNKNAGLADTLAFEATEDTTKKIWITTYCKGITIIDPAAGKIKYLTKASGLACDSLSAATTDEKGQVWIAAPNDRLDAVDTKNGVVRHYNYLAGYQKNFTFHLYADKKGHIWTGTRQGLQIVDPASEMVKTISQQQGLAGNIVTTVMPDQLGNIWLSALSGINIIRQNADLVHPLGTTVAITMMEDSLGNRWIGTDKGIAIIDPKKNIIRFLNKSNGLSNDFIQSFTKSGQQIWVTSNGGLDIIDLSRKTIEHAGKAEGLVKDTVYSIFKDIKENTWLTGPSNGIDLIDPQRKLLLHTGPGKGLSDNNITDIKEDNKGQVWLATGRSGVDIVDLARGIVKNLRQLPGLKDTCTKMMLLDKQGRMWIGTDRGLYVTDTKQETITSISTREGLSNDRVLSLWEYKGSVVAGTSTRINIITAPGSNPSANAGDTTGRQWKITTVNQSEGLFRQQPNAWNTDIITENGEYWWGDRGITVIKDIVPIVDSVPVYITGISIMTQPIHFINDYKNIAADTVWGADTFYLKGKIPSGTGYSTLGKLNWDKVSGPFNMPANLRVPYDRNYIQFQFARTHLGRQDTASYIYLLEGIDKNWSTPTTNLYTENYLNLSPGKYTFKVSSKGIDGRWGRPAVFSFTIAPPWYSTWWAYTLMVLAAAGLLRFYIVYRSRRLKKENSLLEEKVNLRTNQLQQSLEDLRATQSQLIQSEKMASLGELTAGIAHEIQNPLNFVNNFAEVNTELIEEMKSEIDKGNLDDAKAIANDIAANEQKISQHGRRADAIVKGMLQHSRSSSGIKEPTNINALADEYLRLAYHGLRAKDKSFNATLKTDFDKDAGTINIIPQDIGRVILNLITNAFYAVTEKKKMEQTNAPGTSEQTGKIYEPTVTVNTKKAGDRMEIRVRDNGNGIPQKVLEKIFQPFFTTKPTGQGTGLGLSMSYDIITKGHGGDLSVETKEGEGAEFIIQLPLG